MVENEEGKLVGLVSSKNLMRYFAKKYSNSAPLSIGEVMTTNLKTILPETKTIDALGLLREYNISCLPVIRNGKLLGLVTERDFVRLSEEVMREITPKPELDSV